MSRKKPQFGNTLAAFFRLVMEYAEDNPTSDLAVDLKRRIQSAKKPKRPYRRRPLAVIEGAREAHKARLESMRHKIVAEDFTLEEAHDAALEMEASRLIKSSKRKRRKR